MGGSAEGGRTRSGATEFSRHGRTAHALRGGNPTDGAVGSKPDAPLSSPPLRGSSPTTKSRIRLLRCAAAPRRVQPPPLPVLGAPSREGQSRAPGWRAPMTNRPATPTPALNRTTLTLETQIEELRAELSNCLDRKERRQIEAELKAAYAALTALRA